jgi:Fic family protein
LAFSIHVVTLTGTHPYTKIAFIERDLNVSRLTATKYLDALAEQGFLQKQKIGRANYYINVALNRILIGAEMGPRSV